MILLKEYFQGMGGDAFGVLGIAILLDTTTYLLMAFLPNLMVFTVETEFNEHKLSPRLLGFFELLELLGLLDLGLEIFNET